MEDGVEQAATFVVDSAELCFQAVAQHHQFVHQIDDPLLFLAQPDSLIITKTYADQNQLAVNSQVPMRTMDGERAPVEASANSN